MNQTQVTTAIGNREVIIDEGQNAVWLTVPGMFDEHGQPLNGICLALVADDAISIGKALIECGQRRHEQDSLEFLVFDWEDIEQA